MADDFSISIQDASSENEDGIPSIHVNNSNSVRFLTFRIANTSNTDKMCFIYFQPSGNLGTYSKRPSFSAFTCYNKIMTETPDEAGLYVQVNGEEGEIKINSGIGSNRETALRRSISRSGYLDITVKFKRITSGDITGKRLYIGLVAEAGN